MDDRNIKLSGPEATRTSQKTQPVQAGGDFKPQPRRAAGITSPFSGPNLLSFLLRALMGLLDRAAWGGSIGKGFTYQGRLQDSTSAANGIYDLRFTIYDAVSGGNQVGPALTNSAVGVTNGVSSVLLEFGPNVFTGQALWLESAVRTNGAAGFSPLPPREPLTAAPYALYTAQAASASNVANAAISATSLNTPQAAAVQELKRKLEDQAAELKTKDVRMVELEKSMAELKALVKTLAGKVNGGGQ